MFPTMYMDEFVRAVETVERDCDPPVVIVRKRALSLIRRVYALWTDQKGQEFKDLWDVVLIDDKLSRDPLLFAAYREVLVRYFLARNALSRGFYYEMLPPSYTGPKKNFTPIRKKRKRCVAIDLPVDKYEVSEQHVRIWVYNGVSILFRARKPKGYLKDWSDVDKGVNKALSGSNDVDDVQWNRAKRKAFAVMNSRRGFKPKRKKSETTKKVALVE